MPEEEEPLSAAQSGLLEYRRVTQAVPELLRLRRWFRIGGVFMIILGAITPSILGMLMLRSAAMRRGLLARSSDWVGPVIVNLGLVLLGVLSFVAGEQAVRNRWRGFVLAMACIDLLIVPMGTPAGVYAIVLWRRGLLRKD